MTNKELNSNKKSPQGYTTWRWWYHGFELSITKCEEIHQFSRLEAIMYKEMDQNTSNQMRSHYFLKGNVHILLPCKSNTILEYFPYKIKMQEFFKVFGHTHAELQKMLSTSQTFSLLFTLLSLRFSYIKVSMQFEILN